MAKRWLVLVTNVYGAPGGIPAFNRELIRAMDEFAHARGGSITVHALRDEPGQQAPCNAIQYRAYGGRKWSFVWDSLRAAWTSDAILFGHVHFAPLALLIGCP